MESYEIKYETPETQETQETPEPLNPSKNYKFINKNLWTRVYSLSITDEEFELTMSLKEAFLELKLKQKDNISNSYYQSSFSLQKLNKCLFRSFKEIKEGFIFCDKMINENKVKLICLKNKNTYNLNFINVSDFHEETEAYLELERNKLKTDENNSINSKNDDIKKNEELKDYVDKKVEEAKQEIRKEYNKILEEKDSEIKKLSEIINNLKKEQDKKIKDLQTKQDKKISAIEKEIKPVLDKLKGDEKEKKEFGEKNDSIKLLDGFEKYDVNNMKNIKSLSDNLNITWIKSVAVYKINRFDEISYELSYPEYKKGYNIIIYDIISNKISNEINNAHFNEIHRIKHYYYSKEKKDILLTSSSDKSIKLWDISLYSICNIIHIENFFDGFSGSPFCLLFNKNDYYILGGSRYRKKNIWDKNGELIRQIEKSTLDYSTFIEAIYVDSKPYVLLSGRNHSESYDYEYNKIKIYKSENQADEHYIANLFKNNGTIYLITGDSSGSVTIFDFMTAEEIISISVGEYIYSICSVNEKYILVGNNNNELSLIDFENKSRIKDYKAHNNPIIGVEKINADKFGQYIITYSSDEIKIWK